MTGKTLSSTGRPAQLMLVEDNIGDIILAQEAFRSAKIANNMVVARDGEEALMMLFKEDPHQSLPTPDLILLDLNLPRKDGRQVLAEIKARPETANIPVVILTSSSADIDIERSYELRANCYVVKPLNFDRLKDIVASIEEFWFAVVALPSQGKVDTAE